jgi:hypothetical protein
MRKVKMFKVGDRVKIISDDGREWKEPYVGKIGVITYKADKYDWAVKFRDGGLAIHWYEHCLIKEPVVGEQLLFEFMKG